MARPFYVLVAALTWPVLRGLYRLRATGLENLPREGGYVLSANHVSNLDPWALCLPLWPRRQARFMAKAELFNLILTPFLQAIGAFPVRRGEADVEAMATAIELARAGEIVVVFPEGTRRKKGLRKTFEARAHTGAARTAIEAGVPIVPAAIGGTDRLSRLGPPRVTYGRPVALDDLLGVDSREAAQAATDRLMARIHELEASLGGGARY